MTPNGDRSSNPSLAEAAYDAIRKAILCCDLAPGQQVSEMQLAERFGCGRAAVRAALTRLSHEHLVQPIPRHGYAIAPITFKHVQDLFGLRLIVEPAAARLAAGRVDEAMVKELERLNDACARTGERDDIWTLRQANTAFHTAIARASGNDRLLEVAGAAVDELERVLYLPQLAHVWDRIDATPDEHRLIIDALRAHDGAAAEQAATAHILPNKQFIIEALIASPGLRAINLVTV